MWTKSALILLLVVAAVKGGAVPKQPRGLDRNVPHAGGSRGLTRAVYESIQPDNGLERGDWGSVDLCTEGLMVNTFEVKYSGEGFVDDTGLNAVRLYCSNSGGIVNYVSSSEGTYGQWQGLRACTGGEPIYGVRFEALPDQGTFGDDQGLTDMEMLCNGTHEVLGGVGSAVLEKVRDQRVNRAKVELQDGRQVEKIQMTRDSPIWGTWVTCSPGYSLCGVQTRVEPEDVVNDDAGLSDAVFFCC